MTAHENSSSDIYSAILEGSPNGPKAPTPQVSMPGYGGVVKLGPVGHLHDERSQLLNLEWKSFDARLLGATIGAELSKIDLSAELSDERIEEIHQALLAYKVIFFRDQELDSRQQVAFAERFGGLELHPFIPSNTDEPELVRFEKSAAVGGYENQWHHDVTWRECPSKAAVLRAIEVPAVGGDTMFADMHAAYEGLDEEWKERIENMNAVHDYMFAFGAGVPEAQREEMRARFPEVVHPVVARHPQTGRRHLYINRIFTRSIEGMSREESIPVLDFLARQSDVPEYQCRFHWAPNSVAFWDNRAVQHYALSDYWPQPRVMERASIVGERPVA